MVLPLTGESTPRRILVRLVTAYASVKSVGTVAAVPALRASAITIDFRSNDGH